MSDDSVCESCAYKCEPDVRQSRASVGPGCSPSAEFRQACTSKPLCTVLKIVRGAYTDERRPLRRSMLCLLWQILCGVARCAVPLVPAAILILRLRMLRDLWQDFANILTFYQTAFIGGTLTGCTAAMINLLGGKSKHQQKVRFCSSMTG